MKFNVRVRIVNPYGTAVHETQEYEADTGLEAMKKAVVDKKNSSRGAVSSQGADPLPYEAPPKKKAKKEVDGDTPVTVAEAELSDG